MTAIHRVEWSSTDAAGAERCHVSHDLSRRDARGMAETLRAADTRQVRIVRAAVDADGE